MRTNNYGWVVMGTLLLIDSMVMGITFTLGIMMPVISNDLSMDLRQVGWLGAMNWEVGAILTVPVAFRMGRFSPRKTVLISCALQIALLITQGLSPNYGVLLASRIAFMATGLIRYSANPMLIQQWFPSNRIALVNTVATVFSGISGGTVVFFMGKLLDVFDGWRNIFFIFGGIYVLLLLAWLKLGKENPASGIKPEALKLEGIGTVLKNKTLWLLAIGVSGDLICFGAMETLWPKYITSLGVLSLEKAAYCEGLSYYGFTIGSLIGGLLSMRLGRRKPAIWISGLLLPFVTFGILYSRSFPVLALLWAMWGICELYSPIAHTIPYELPNIKPQQVAVASAFVASIIMGGAGLGPVLGVYLADLLGSLQNALVIICGFPILLFFTGIMLKETGPRARLRELS